MKNYDQNVVIDKLNEYLKLQERDLKLDRGYCHGLSLLWLYKMSIGQEQWFYDAIKRIASCKEKDDFDKNEFDFEKIISHIQWLQSPEKVMPDIQQMDIDKITDGPRNLSLAFLFTQRQLRKTLQSVIEKNSLVCLSGPTHTIGVTKRGDTYFIFDPNYDAGQAKQIKNIVELKLEIIRCLFKSRRIYEDKIPIEINIANFQEKSNRQSRVNKHKLIDKLIESSDEDIDDADYDGMTNLYLAVENHDVDEVEILLKKGANPNKPAHGDWTPLQFSASRGFTDIAEKLISLGADVDLADKMGRTALYFAADKKFEPMIKLLLNHGADPTKASKSGETPLNIALKANKEMFTLMLSSVNNEKSSSAKHGLFAEKKQVLESSQKYRVMKLRQT